MYSTIDFKLHLICIWFTSELHMITYPQSCVLHLICPGLWFTWYPQLGKLPSSLQHLVHMLATQKKNNRLEPFSLAKCMYFTCYGKRFQFPVQDVAYALASFAWHSVHYFWKAYSTRLSVVYDNFTFDLKLHLIYNLIYIWSTYDLRYACISNNTAEKSKFQWVILV